MSSGVGFVLPETHPETAWGETLRRLARSDWDMTFGFKASERREQPSVTMLLHLQP